MKRYAAVLIDRLRRALTAGLSERVDRALLLSAKSQVHRVRQLGAIENLSEAEFKVFSQWGEDGIIQYLIHRVPIIQEAFVEFGVENYRESNTRFLLINDNWKGLVLDGASSNVDFIRNDDIYWKHDLQARCCFVTRENINEILIGCGFEGDIGLLSIDVDGNDYWIWDAIECTSPRIVACEYNSVFGKERALTVPYRSDFVRTRAHYSNLYYGCSLPALCLVAGRKGYDFVGTNSAGSNAFFVRSDLDHGLKALSADEGYVECKVRESRGEKGELTYVGGESKLKLIEHLPVYDIERDAVLPLSEMR